MQKTIQINNKNTQIPVSNFEISTDSLLSHFFVIRVMLAYPEARVLFIKTRNTICEEPNVEKRRENSEKRTETNLSCKALARVSERMYRAFDRLDASDLFRRSIREEEF